MNIRMDVKGLSEVLQISKFAFDLHGGDRAVSIPKTAFTANINLTRMLFLQSLR